MARPKHLTTRRARFEYDRSVYINREQRHRAYNHKRHRDTTTGVLHHVGRKWEHERGAKMFQPLKTADTYDGHAAAFFNGIPLFVTISTAGFAKPPHVHIGAVIPWRHPPQWTHPDRALVGFHKRCVKRRKKRPRNSFWTALNLRIRGCNWFYFRNGFYPDDDVLGRHPVEADITGPGDLYPTGPWPVPNGFVG